METCRIARSRSSTSRSWRRPYFHGLRKSSVSCTALWQMTVDAVRECARRAAECDVIIGVQNRHDLAAHYQAQFDLVTAVGEPNCRAIFDAWAPALQGTGLVEAARKM